MHSKAQNNLTRALKDPLIAEHKEKLMLDFQEKGLSLGEPAFVRIFKQDPENQYGIFEIWVKPTQNDSFVLAKTYKVCFHYGKLGPKYAEGDGQTPEGFYAITAGGLNQYSSFLRSMNIGYPNAFDRANGYTGSYIMIHGGCQAIGCFAMTDEQMAEIWTISILTLNQQKKTMPVHVFPFRMTDENMKKYSNPDLDPFWKNLKQGYDYFEQNRILPEITFGKKYLFH